jgi:Domain of unknown function (DUF4180)
VHEAGQVIVAAERGIAVRSLSDVADAVAAAFGAAGLLLTEQELSKDFFDLKSGIAGELFQKLENYRVRAAIVVPNPALHGERFTELAREYRTHNRVRILPSRDEALRWLVA